ncbi:hypothetical protein [Desulfoluna spongiiphila]|uniref:PilZ domain-containing protein n=1 Tax=Desulfoluna spongiiphila TaxID=419481 RepID=A0A1G5G2M0_9BACT|nr:hypothetical protein [Desulfoluna spongiiphila]SCY45577.1 hypothetical protein SAMN05216233_109158 [Desulfoluna spongiiphila]
MTASQAALKICQPSRPEPQDSAFLTKGKEVGRKHLINALNHINFKEKNVILVFQSVHGNPSMEIEAFPMPVLSDYPTFRFLKPLPDNLRSTDLTRLIIPDGPGEIHAIPQLRAMNSKGLSVNLPETGRRIQGALRNIRVHFQQQGIAFKGSLTSIEPDVIEVQLSPLSSHYFMATSPKAELNLTFLKEKNRLFETKARVVKQESHRDSVILHLEPIESIPTNRERQRFGKKAFEMIPAPDFVFLHPLTGTKCTVVIESLSAIDMKLTLHHEMIPLIPGMKLMDASITLGDLYTLQLTAQVTRCSTIKNKRGDKIEYCHISILNMSSENHRKLQTIVHKSENRDIRVCNSIEEDDMWRFFFETGFIYKNKYRLFLENKDKIKKTYETLYSTPSNVTCHMAYQEKGRTMGHISMLRYAERAWLVHHHAALRGASIRVGLGVLKQMGNYVMASHNLDPNSFKYLLCYFRPENHFPNYFFSGFTEKKKDPKICSSDLFAYVYYRAEKIGDAKFPDGWVLEGACETDLVALETCYDATSGGMLIDALNLYERQAPFEVLSERYQKAGLKKEQQIWAIRHNDLTVALFIVNTSDVALNMSELSNCIKTCIIRPDIMNKQILTRALDQLSEHFSTHRTPVLIHPVDWVKNTGFHFQKRYHLWILNTHFLDDFMQHLDDSSNLSRKTN